MVDSSLGFDKGKDKKNEKGYMCSFCDKVFHNCQALRGHQRVHQSEIKQLTDQNYVIPSNNSMDITRSRSNPKHENASIRSLSKGTKTLIYQKVKQ